MKACALKFSPQPTHNESNVEIPRIRHGKKQTLGTLINEEALVLAKFLRNERKEWNPRLPKM